MIPNLGVAIILLTFTIMLILYPLTAKQAKSMIAMQRVQPEIKKLQAKYKNDRQKLNEEMMKFYQENKINPLAGCLPLLVQMPIFFSLFRVLRDPVEVRPDRRRALHRPLHGSACGTMRATCDRATSANGCRIHHLRSSGWTSSCRRPTPTAGSSTPRPYFILVGLVILTGFLQTRQAQKRTPAANKQMGMVMQVLPDLLRAHLAELPGRSGPLLLREQPLAARPAGGHLPAARLGAARSRREGRRTAKAT